MTTHNTPATASDEGLPEPDDDYSLDTAYTAADVDRAVASAIEAKDAELAELRERLAEARRVMGQARFCLRELLPDDPDAVMTVRMIDAALAVKWEAK